MFFIEFETLFYTAGVANEVLVVRTLQVQDALLCVSDLQESAALNRAIWEAALSLLRAECGDAVVDAATLVLAGDLYGESFVDANTGKRVEIRGKSGCVDYAGLTGMDDPKATPPAIIVYGNHDLVVPGLVRMPSGATLAHGTHVGWADWIESKRFPCFLADVERALGTKSGCDVLVTHDTPLLDKQTRGSANLARLVGKYPPKVHVFGHCHLATPLIEQGATLFVNCDARFILLLPEKIK